MPADLKKLKTSWTKYDAVQFIIIVGNDELESYLNREKEIDEPILKSYLGIKSLNDNVPQYWKDVIDNYPSQRKLFALLAGIFTHHENIENFANRYSTLNMEGVFKMESGGKHQTNLRSALVESGAALNSYRRKADVPYDFKLIFETEGIGKNFKMLLQERLQRVGYSDREIQANFYETCFLNDFHKTISLNKVQFKSWLEGKAITPMSEIKYDIDILRKYQHVNAIKINQWLENWDSVDFNQPMRSRPDESFYLFKMDIRLLKRISDVHRRKATKARMEETNIQRALHEERTVEIRNYVQSGFPLSTLTNKDRSNPENDKLKMPGFLPTAILVNILGPDQKRGNSQIRNDDLITIDTSQENTRINLPDRIFDEDWQPSLKPVEVIDGQHRLWAFDEGEIIKGDYEVPVIAYYNLDRAWQAYLFYVINIKPKKINTSLGYDLYPLLRTQEWLENSKDGLIIYRETRAQELVEALWLYKESPWHNRINMLGHGDSGNISQNAFVRALTTSFLRKSSRKTLLSGLFADVLYNKNAEEIKWVRAQQAAFLVLLWDTIAKTIQKCEKDVPEWISKLRAEKTQLTLFERDLELDKAFVSKNSNLSRDQGVTALMMFANDFFYVLANESDLDLNELEWLNEIDEKQIETSSIDAAIKEFRNHKVYSYIQLFANDVIRFDWRTSSAEFDDENQRELSKKYKGSSGYREMWKDLLFKAFLTSSNDVVVKYAKRLEELSK